MVESEIAARIAARRVELDELEDQLVKQLVELRAERDELAVAERVWQRMAEQLAAETAAAAPVEVAGRATTATINGRTVTTFLGIAPTLRIGEIELHNVPVSWTDGAILAFPNGVVPSGTIGTVLLYHFLTTIDYRGRSLVLQRRTTAQQRAFRAGPARAALRPQPLWLAGDHLPCTLGKLNDYGPRVAVMDTGAIAIGLNTSAANAERAGITIDWSDPTPVNGGTATVYPITPDRISIGDAVGQHLPGSVGPTPWEAMTGVGGHDRVRRHRQFHS